MSESPAFKLGKAVGSAEESMNLSEHVRNVCEANERLREENKQLREAARKVLDYEHHPSRSSLSNLRAALGEDAP